MLAGITTPAPPRPLSPAIISFSTRTHLSNLQLLLPKPPPQPPPQPPPPPPPLPLPTTKKPRFNLKLPSFLCPPLTGDSSSSSSDNTISPRTLTHLRHLLSSPPLPSPKNNISSHWHLYHGSGDWSNLLDPLDENLRRELIRYGELIQSAYQSFHSSTSISLPSHHSYRPTQTLFATSSIPLPPRFTNRSNPIGYIAVCDDPTELRRMGRRDILIVLRGTSTLLEWAENFRANLVPLDSDDVQVECGFRSLYKTSGDGIPSLSSSIIAEVQRLLNLYSGENLSITVTGHSLGAALAVLVADELSMTCSSSSSSSTNGDVPIAVFSFGGPRVGNRAFADRVRRRGVRVLRVVNAGDVVTKVPGVLPREEEEEPWHVLHGWLDGYAHVGRELRVDSRVSPYLRPNPDPACCHDLEAYLHLVDGYLGSDSPFRSNAKRSLVKLFSQQGSNVKKPFVSTARALGF
ncbi:Phospholipase A(1) protein [Dioscorea alata]|uniref:Phospholipase A(1) protein n=1 Tax=Dioscorea alata TaxID=55571 RepID=A0ACB7WVR0_DIOAL|nr:Phospholipase A(1) protein [Dioscorea alata]